MINVNRVFSLAGRVFRQIFRDRRTMGLFMIGPLVVVTLAAVLLRSEGTATPVGVVDEDTGATIMLIGEVNLADRIISQIEDNEALVPVILTLEEVDDALRAGRVRAAVIFSEDFSATFAETRQANLRLRLEGSDPIQAATVVSNLSRSAMQAFAGIASLIGMSGNEDGLPLNIQPEYLYGGEEYDTLDFIAPPYLALIVFFFVFLLTTVSFLRERSQGTIERLMATPVTRVEIVLGYMLGFLVFALAQEAILLAFTVTVIKIHYIGNLLNVFIVEALLAIVAVNLGIFLSTFARNEFQVLQFIPLVIFPMLLLSGLFWPVEDLPGFLQPVANVLPLTHANNALRAIMIKGWGLGDVMVSISGLMLFALAMLALAGITMRREVA